MNLKRTLTSITFLLVFTIAYAQGPPPITQPQASPRAEISQTIGITTVSIDYGRPAVKEREILGKLVPFDQIWRAGANENTRISFDKPVVLGEKTIPAGTYGLHMIPSQEDWTVIISKDHESWGSYFYSEDNDVTRLKANMTKTDYSQERLAYGFDNISSNGADVFLHWSTFKVSFPIKINTNDLIIKHIEDEYLKNIAGFFWQGFNNAANYAIVNNIALDKGLAWADQSISINKNFANMSTKSLILRMQGKAKEADEFIEKAMPMADENAMNTYGYGLLYNLKDVDAAIKVFQKNVKDYPESWNVYDSLAEAYQTKGNKKEAIKYYKKALSMAPEQQRNRIKSTIDSLSS
ncbi:DUF2911 domain-containing protein [Hyphobacterium sp. CCMP332]|nr:DUF2911 domain-containing protein [Hyphobacterium sp. CCMP332]